MALQAARTHSLSCRVVFGGSRHSQSRCSTPRRQVATCAIKLYANPRSRSVLVEWYLQELGVEYEAVQIDLAKNQHKSEWFLKINPLGKLPAIEDGEFKLWESGAILLYLAENYAAAGDSQTRALLAQWALFANSTMGNAIFLEAFREKQMPVVMNALQEQLATRDYLLGSNFTAADVAVGGYLLYIVIFFPKQDLSTWPAVQAYMKRLSERSACQATMGVRLAESKAELG